MARSQSVLIPCALVAAALYQAQQAFVAPSAPALRSVRSLNTACFGGGPSVPTGLVWPSPEAEAKLREVDGIKLYPTHAWTDDMEPIVAATNKLRTPR
jgi:hypothetical protein